MKHFILATAFTLLFNAILAAPTDNAGVAITNPVINSTVPAGSNFTIKWTVLNPNASDIKFIKLMNGDSMALNTVIPNILNQNTTIPVNATGYTWTVPANMTASNDYVIAMLGDGPFATYSGYFSIVTNKNSTEGGATPTTAINPVSSV